MKAVYIHIPFCKKICTYCDFCKFFYNEKWVDLYLDALEKEIKDRYMDEQISSIYIGGGTPSSLNMNQLKKLFLIINIFKTKDLEFTFECNLNDINEELIKLLSQNKVNRLSIGIESFDINNLKIINRTAEFKDALNKINIVKKYINNINVDLMYALPGETLKTLKKDLNLFKKLNVNHISTYSLMIEPNTILYQKKLNLVSEEQDYEMYKLICKKLKKWHYNHYEVSNFAKEGYASKHNLTYWNNEEYYGFGCGASGYIEGIRYENTKSLSDYINKRTMINEEILSDKEKMDYEVILGLRKTDGINIKKFYEKYHVNFQNTYHVNELIEEKLLIYKNGNIFIKPSKLYIMNEILVRMI